METAMLIIGIILLVFAVFLVVAVLMQQGKAHNLSGAIAGGAETFFGKSKAQTINKKLSILTTIVAIVFVLLVTSVYVIQDSGKSLDDYDNIWQAINPFSEEDEKTEGKGEEQHNHDHSHEGEGEETTAPTGDDTTAAAGDDTTAAAGDDTTAPAGDDTTVAA